MYDVLTTTAFLPSDSPALAYRGERQCLQTEGLVEFAITQYQTSDRSASTLIQESLNGIEKTIPLIERLSERHHFPALPKTLAVFCHALEDSSSPTPSDSLRKTRRPSSRTKSRKSPKPSSSIRPSLHFGPTLFFRTMTKDGVQSTHQMDQTAVGLLAGVQTWAEWNGSLEERAKSELDFFVYRTYN